MRTWLRRLLQPRPRAEMPKRFEGDYRVFTTAFDQVVSSEGIEAAIQLDPRFFPPPDFDKVDAAAAEHYEASAAALVQALSGNSHSLAVTLLLDHSGSTRGHNICLIASLAGVVSQCLDRLSIPHEILGFTTSSWKGGRAAQLWRDRGSPQQPGRVCDLLHVIHKDFSHVGSISVETIERMLNPHLLKENIDGEAVLWAVERLRQRPEARKVLIVVSDGAPVDDATLLANGPNILDDHIRKVVSDVVAAGDAEIYGIGIEYGMFRYYPQFAVVEESEDIGLIALPVLQAVLASDTHAPKQSQLPLPDFPDDEYS